MTNTPLLTIGAFARAVGLTPSALRHYDERGLLPPAAVDDASGYRYYTPDLAERARLIVAMREAGVPIETMRQVLDGPEADADRLLEGLVREREAEVARVHELLRALTAVPPGRPGPAVGARGRVVGPVLASALRQVRAAAESDPASPLSGVLIDLADGAVDVVATNRYWMAIRTIDAVEGSGAGRAVLTLADVGRLADLLDGHELVDARITGDRLELGDALATFEGRSTPYPAHRLLLDGLDAPTVRVVVAVRELVAAVADAARAEVDVEITPAGMTIAADEVPAVAVRATVRTTVRDDSPLTVRIGSALLLRSLATCLGAEVLLELVSGDRAVRLSSPYQPGFSALVMPIRPE